ncbi:hypothetical protein S245_065058, partial [Arachis hypogaea]
HELRTHMAAIIGLLDILMSDDCLTNEQCATVTHIRKCLTVLFRLLNNILDLSKVESGKLILEDAEFNLGRELEGLVDMFSVQSMNHSLETVLDLSVKCDSMKAENEATVAQDMKKELQEFKLQYKKLKVEHASFHDIADKMIEEKDNEISRLSDDNRNLRQSLQSRPH